PTFPAPIPASRLRIARGARWLWHGYLARGSITLLTALWKSGKTTLLAHLLREMETGGSFCGLDLESAQVLMVTEESDSRWAERRDQLVLKDNIDFLIRPFRNKSSWDSWKGLLAYLAGLCQRQAYDLVVFDPLVYLWPVRDENDASQVEAALMPLHGLGEAT